MLADITVKPLILTLIFAVIATTIGAGWLITRFHSSVDSVSEETDQNLIAYKQLGEAIGLSLDGFSHREDFIRHWEEKSEVEIHFQSRSDFQVPDDIAETFRDGIPLLLESEGEMSLHLYLKNTDQVMSLLSPISGRSQQSPLNLILTLLFYLVVIAVLLAWLYPLIRRLVMLQQAATKFGTGDLSSRIKPSRTSYIASIEKDFNRMANQIQTLVDDNQLLSRAVSHNLKTPITRLRMGIDVLEEAADSAEKDRYIKRINNDLDEMQSLVETLLYYSSLDEFELRLENERIDLCQFIPNIINNKITTCIIINSDYPDGEMIVHSDPKYLGMALTNILSNAIQYSKSTILVSVSLKELGPKKNVISVTVEDDGKGISENDRVNAMKPFWRGHSEPAIKGHGMGLAIVARIAQWLKIKLTIDRSTSLGGASISMTFNIPEN